ncbi:hypothetical protein A5784_23805 [Mycobacterium sp. 852013-50091_SCH5140682]|uniref:DUF4242 domain-containing protein n=1 Tax=Mycobacterium sp. 852013-50091_SCH5140682 TaxID=1834109 RepID=UPI0007E9BC2D|nr:DUF4242 domain-containing protein [Mycobacterium sp. 852013-50091_SCH5140682]OBC17429.1 hypothetical protein A5784_23805 [Mycobacterium sp. 852013-50091_SCH5140682]
MTLFLYEIALETAEEARASQLIKDADAEIHRAGGELIEAQVTQAGGRVFIVAEFADAAATLDSRALGVGSVAGPDQVRLVGADLAALKAARPHAGYLVEWHLPEDLDMESYLARKKANAPKYAEVPEVDFLRTYVREDMDKCLCLYDAPDEDAVRRARRAVSTPIDRLHGLAAPTP